MNCCFEYLDKHANLRLKQAAQKFQQDMATEDRFIKKEKMMIKLELVQEMEENLNKLKKELSLEQLAKIVPLWEPPKGDWLINGKGDIINFTSPTDYIRFGMAYQTEEQAIWARDMMRSYHRQLAWISENDDGWRADWSDNTQNKYFISYLYVSQKYIVVNENTAKDLSKIYMSKENAIKLCDLLNTGVVIL